MKICCMAICPATQGDKLVWVGTKTGDYSVRSGYHMAKENSAIAEGSTSNPSQLKHLWRMVWNLKGPRAVKMFLWKACSNILPTKSNLFKRGIVKDQFCPICETEIETIGYGVVRQQVMYGWRVINLSTNAQWMRTTS